MFDIHEKYRFLNRVKVRYSQKQIMVFSILPKTKQNSLSFKVTLKGCVFIIDILRWIVFSFVKVSRNEKGLSMLNFPSNQIIEVSANSQWISRNDAKLFSSNEDKTKKEPTSHTYRRIWKWTCQQNFNRSNCQNGQVLLTI